MNIPTDRHRRIHYLDVALFNQQLPRLVAEFADRGLGNGFARAELRDVSTTISSLNSIFTRIETNRSRSLILATAEEARGAGQDEAG